MCGKSKKIEFLPYHAMGENKYRAIGKEPKIFKVPDAERINKRIYISGVNSRVIKLFDGLPRF